MESLGVRSRSVQITESIFAPLCWAASQRSLEERVRQFRDARQRETGSLNLSELIFLVSGTVQTSSVAYLE